MQPLPHSMARSKPGLADTGCSSPVKLTANLTDELKVSISTRNREKNLQSSLPNKKLSFKIKNLPPPMYSSRSFGG